MKIGELFVALGIDADTPKVKDFAKAVGEVPVQAAAAVVALAGLTLKIKDMILAGVEGAEALEKFSLRTGLSAQDLNRWQIVAAQANVSAEEMASSVESLQRNLAEIQLGRGNIAPFQMLGITTHGKNAFQILDQLRQRVKSLPSATATNFISQMGLSPDTIKVLRLTDQEFQKFSRTAHGMGKAQQEAFLKVKLAATQLGLVFRDVVWNVLANIIEGFERLRHGLARFEFAIPAIIAGLGLMAAAFFPITAAVTGLLLVLEDLAVFAAGGDSLFGRAMAAFTGRKVGPKGWKESLGTIKNTDAGTIGKVLGDILSGGFKKVGAVEERSYVSPSQFRDRVREVNQTINVEQHIHGTDDAKATGEAATESLRRATNDASLQIPVEDQ